MNKLELYLCDFYGADYCCVTGNGTTAMYLLFQALAMQHKKVLYPAISCTNPVNAAIYAGYKVCFCDVNMSDYTIDLDRMDMILKTCQDIGIVVPTHIYGHLYDREKARYICDKYGILLLEDAAQTVSVGQSYASVVSFGHTKIFENKASGGGAILLYGKDIYDKVRQVRKMLRGKRIGIGNALFDVYRDRYYAIVNNSQYSQSKKYQLLYQLQLDSKKYFIYDKEVSYHDVSAMLGQYSDIITARIDKALLYKQSLCGENIIWPDISFDNHPVWRVTFLVEKKQKEILTEVRRHDIDISSWYLPLNKIYSKQVCPSAEYIADHVINLWVDEMHSLEKIKKNIFTLNQIMGELTK